LLLTDVVQLKKGEDIAIITINNPPVNALSPGVPEGISEALDHVVQDPSIRAVVLIGGGRTFVAGANIKEFGKTRSGKPRGAGTSPFALEDRRQQQTCDCGDPWNGIWWRIGIGDGRALSRGCCW
jgi:enoyl-CoA hydratase/carnithine racemase